MYRAIIDTLKVLYRENKTQEKYNKVKEIER